MKRKLSKILCVVMAIIMTFTLVSCGKKKVKNDESTIILDYWSAGLGLEFLNEAIKGFEAKYPNYKVALSTNPDDSVLRETISRGEKYNSIDLYMCSALTGDFNQYFEPLDDILTSKYGDENVTIGEKYNQTYLNALKSSDGHYYTLSYGGGYVGIVYNADIIDGETYKVPNTTDELVKLCSKLSSRLSNGVKVWSSFARNAGYWTYNDEVWQAQYDGLDYFLNNYLTLTNDSGESPSKDVFMKKDGRYQVLKLQEKLQNPAYVSNSAFQDDYSDAQTKFLNGKGVMMATGTWLINEMKKSNDNLNFKMMKTPVISALIDKLTTVEDDEELSALVQAIDACKTANEVALKGEGYDVSEADRNRVFEARNLSFSTHNESAFMIPNYSNAKEAAKEFIRYFYSDENIKKCENITRFPLVINVSTGESKDTTGWSAWDLDNLKRTNESIPIFRIKQNQSLLFSTGGLAPYGLSNYKFLFAAPNPNDRKTSDQIWDDIIAWGNDNWQDFLTKAGY